MLREASLHLIKVLLRYGADARESSKALFDAIDLDKAAAFRLLVGHHADIHVRLVSRFLAQCALQGNHESIGEHFLNLDITVPARPLALFVGCSTLDVFLVLVKCCLKRGEPTPNFFFCW